MRNMKKMALLILPLATLVFSCKKSSDFLETKTNGITEDMVFTDSIRTVAFLNGIYGDIAYSFNKGRWDSHGNTEQATDDAEYNFSGSGQKAVILYSGSVSPTNFPFTEFWNTPYANIRRVNLLMAKIGASPLSAGMKTRMVAEARFLRCWYYYQLIVTFGGVPLVQDNVYGIDDLLNLPRNSFADCINYVGSELDAVAQVLPATYAQDIDYGRATRGACLALKAKMLLVAASPLFNGGAITSDAAVAPLVGYPTYSVSYWQKAADAALAVINSNYYSLYTDNTTALGYGFPGVFLKRVNSEYIFAYHRTPNRDMEGFYNPPSRGGAKYSMPTQNLVDAFPMKNGKAPFNADGSVNTASGYDPANPYANRDPRFGYSIIYNTSSYFSTTTNSKIPVFTYDGAATDGFGIGTTTGYYSRKMCDENISANSSSNTERGWPLIRYAEILLAYAEAINETGQTALAYDPLKQLRQRAGIDPGSDGLYGLKANMTVAEMREIIRTERRVELAFEDQRWHDIRRWKIAMVTNNQFNKVMKITRSGTSPNFVYTYTVTESVRRHNFRPEMYLLPIPDDEIRKMPAMKQNPGW